MNSRVWASAGASLIAASAVLFTRAGYGPLGDRNRRGQPCVASRCTHNATALLAAALVAFWLAARPEGRNK